MATRAGSSWHRDQPCRELAVAVAVEPAPVQEVEGDAMSLSGALLEAGHFPYEVPATHDGASRSPPLQCCSGFAGHE